MTNNNTYLAITIGPIYKTMKQTRKTRELWSVSFTFSRLMRHLMTTFEDFGDIISPDNDKEMPKLHGAGIWPDRCFIKLKDGNLLTETQIKDAKAKAFIAFEEETGIKLSEHYYQVYIVQKATDSPILELNQLLDVMELQNKYAPAPVFKWADYWKSDQTGATAQYFQSLYREGYEPTKHILRLLKVGASGQKIRRFPSIPEISTMELYGKDRKKYWGALGYQTIEPQNPNQELYFERLQEELDDDDKIIDALKNTFQDEFKFRHKYFTIVQADGDNVGKLIKALEQQGGDITEFSKLMAEFAKKSAEVLVQFGAFPVYIGGDDLLFFAPMANEGVGESFGYAVRNPNPMRTQPATGNIFGTNLFFLLHKLNEVFTATIQPIIDSTNAKIIDEKNKLNPVSLSFGVMVGYYKQPMSEILQSAYELLFYRAKKDPLKNKISMTIQKHSGQSFDVDMRQSSDLFDCFMQLSVSSKNKEENFLNSLMYKLGDQKVVLAAIATDKIRLEAFFKENFNEAKHIDYQEFFQDMILLIMTVFREAAQEESEADDISQEEKEKKLDEKIKRIYSTLRFIHFLNAKDSDE